MALSMSQIFGAVYGLDDKMFAEPKPLPPHDGSPDYMEPVIGWRMWSVQEYAVLQDVSARWMPESAPLEMMRPEKGLRLFSAHGTKWEPYAPMEARHGYTYRERAAAEMMGTPLPECTGSPCEGHVPYTSPKCGIYSFRETDKLREELKRDLSYSYGIPPEVQVIGRVAHWGRLIEHQFGVRSQFAYPVEFVYCTKRDWGARVAQAYGVPYNEDNTWRSVYHFDERSQSPYGFPFPTNQFLGLSHSTHQWWRNQSPRYSPPANPSPSPLSFQPKIYSPPLTFKGVPLSPVSGQWVGTIPIVSSPIVPPGAVFIGNLPNPFTVRRRVKGDLYLAPTFNKKKQTVWQKQDGVYVRVDEEQYCECFFKGPVGTICALCERPVEY